MPTSTRADVGIRPYTDHPTLTEPVGADIIRPQK